MDLILLAFFLSVMAVAAGVLGFLYAIYLGLAANGERRSRP